MADDDRGLPDLADRLDHLFTTVRRPGGRDLWSNEQAALELGRLRTPMSAAYLSQLRHGKRNNPSARHLDALATLFAVPITYFFDSGSADDTDHDLLLSSALQDPDIRVIALRAHGLSPGALDCVKRIVDHFRGVEQLP